MLRSVMDSQWQQYAETACTKLLFDIDIMDHIDLPYALPYINYVMSWKYHLPIKTIIIGQNPYPQNIYPYMGAALSYDESLVKSPPRSAKALAEDLFIYNGTQMSDTVECIKNSWHLLENGTILINETVFSMIYPHLKNNRRSTVEMESQTIALQSIISISYMMGQTNFTVVGMGESAALMMDQLKKWCPSDIIKMKAIGCRNPAARERGDLMSHEFTLNHNGASKVIAAEVAWYHTMPPKDNGSKRVEQSEKSLKQSLDDLNVSKNTGKTEIDNLAKRFEELSTDTDFAKYAEKLNGPLAGARKAIIGHTNSVRSNQMQLIAYVNTAMAALQALSSGTSVDTSTANKDIQKLAKVNPPRRPLKIKEEDIPTTSNSSIMDALKNTPAKKPKDMNVRPKINITESVVAPSEATSVILTPGMTDSIADSTISTPAKKKRDMSIINTFESVNLSAFANWFRNNHPEDPVYAGILQTIVDTKQVGDSSISKQVIKYIRTRKKENPNYDAHSELEDTESATYIWVMEVKQQLG